MLFAYSKNTKLATKKSVRVQSGRGGRPNRPIRHDSGIVDSDDKGGIEELTPDDDIHRVEEIEADIREEIRLALVENLPNIKGWITAVGIDDPKGALSIMKDYIEFVLPKLQRTDSKMDSANPVILNFETIEDYELRKKNKEIPKEERKPKIDFNDDFPTIN